MLKPTAVSSDLRRFDDLAPRVQAVALGVGVVGLLASVIAAPLVGREVFFRSYILNFVYVMSLALGALFFVMIQHATSAGWSVAVRRVAECVAATIPWMAVLFLPVLIPVLMGYPEIYPWASESAVRGDHLLEHKSPYFNIPFFLLRCVIYFGVWSALAVWLLRKSVEQDRTGDPWITDRMRKVSAPGLVLFGLTTTFYAVDVLMSLNVKWFSTMWGVYHFSGCVVGFMALLALILRWLQRAGRLTASVDTEHYHDVGKLAFAFVVFWTYIAFSQYMLIWYANIPEETTWLIQRQKTAWWIGAGLFLLFGHFVAPFFVMLSRHAKRSKIILTLSAIWLLLVHWVDIYYLVIPRPFVMEGAQAFSTDPPYPLMVTDVTLLVGLGGLFAFLIARQMARQSLIPERDPRLPESLAFENM
jgi:hypothetical protein